jgi:ATP-dependent Clp protease ATP-binding subunit ClpB
LRVELSAAAKEMVARPGYDPVFGARPLKRFLQRHLETRLARAIVAGEVPDGALVEVGVRDDELALEVVAPGRQAVETAPVGVA